MVVLNLLLLCIFTTLVSAFFPYVPKYRCVEEGTCLDLAGRETPAGTLDEAPERPGIFKIKIEQTPHTVCNPRKILR